MTDKNKALSITKETITSNNEYSLNKTFLPKFNTFSKDEIKDPYLPKSLIHLAEKPLWVCFDLKYDNKGKLKKLPINPHTGQKASISVPSTWSTFNQAKNAITIFENEPSSKYKPRYLGIALTEDINIIAIDLDNVYDSNSKTLVPYAKEIIDRCNSYTELSVSKKGIHIYGYGKKTTNKCRKNEIEIYDKERFMIVTNDPFGEIKPLKNISEDVHYICEKYGLIDDSPKSITDTKLSPSMEDETIIQKALSAKNGNKFASLFENGDISAYISPSEADMALCCMIAFWTQNFDQIERIWRKSALWRSKGDKRKDYVNKTINNSLNNTEIYTFFSNQEKPTKKQKEKVILPGGPQTISASAKKLGQLLAKSNKFFLRGGKLIEIINGDCEIITPEQFCSDIEDVAIILSMKNLDFKPTILSKDMANRLIASKSFQREMPKINLVSQCPLLIPHQNSLILINKYHEESGIMISSGNVSDISFEEAKNSILSLLDDFIFDSLGDKNRAIAAIITPALVLGGILEGRAPITIIEADNSQAGKGYLVKLITAIYNTNPSIVTQKKGGVGSFEESFNSCLCKGKPFISFDNIRGKINSPALESFMTEDKFLARIPHSKNIEIDASRFFLFLTSNKAEMTIDFANRASIIKIRKQSETYSYKFFPEGDLLDHVKDNQGLYLGAIFSIIKKWFNLNRPKTTESRHTFRKWCRYLDWIVQNIFESTPLMDGHKETQQRVTNLNLNWLRDVAITIIKSKNENIWFRTSQLINLFDEFGIEIPGITEKDNLTNEISRQKAQTSFGRKIGNCFKNIQSSFNAIDIIILGNIKIERKILKDERGGISGPQEVKEYRFSYS